MTFGTPMPMAIPTNTSSILTSSMTDMTNSSCHASLPFRVQPLLFKNASCIQGRLQNDSMTIDVGDIAFTTCDRVQNFSSPLCPSPGQVFICGNNLAYTYLPTNWAGSCVLAALLPDLDVIPGDEPVPLSSFDLIAGRTKKSHTYR